MAVTVIKFFTSRIACTGYYLEDNEPGLQGGIRDVIKALMITGGFSGVSMSYGRRAHIPTVS